MQHCGKTYHEFMLGSARDKKVRERFQRLVFRMMPPDGTILDFGAGTGIDAACYAAKGYRVLVHEPQEPNLSFLTEQCREQIASGSITVSDLSATRNVDMIVANFAVLNLIGDHRALFAKFAGLVAPRGLVLASLLNPFFLGDAHYGWWRRNLRALAADGAYTVDGEFGRIFRFAPSIVRLAARPDFIALRSVPRWPRLAMSRYVFMLFQKQ